MKKLLVLYFCFYIFSFALQAEELLLKDNLKLARVGDYIVTLQSKTITILLVDEIVGDQIGIEEISVPVNCINLKTISWKNWLLQEGPNNSAWVRYVVDTNTGEMKEFYSYTKEGYYTVPKSDNFLSTLLNIRLKSIPIMDRKRVGRSMGQSPEKRALWQPKLVFEGQTVSDATFTAWKTLWPKDGTELSGKTVEIYLPEQTGKYPGYFPYWLQVSGLVGKAKVHIIDSGTNANGKYK